MVAAGDCRSCPFVDHHLPDDSTIPPAVLTPEMPIERLMALIEGPPRPWPAGWEDWEVTNQAHQIAADRFLTAVPEFPTARFGGRGAVIVGGGRRFFPSVYVTVNALRYVGWTDPIQVWYLGRDNEMPDPMRRILSCYGVECVDADGHRRDYPCRILEGWELKAFAVLHSPFAEVLSLDADCYPVRNPTVVFHDPSYRATGAIFWPDTPNGTPLNWQPFGVTPPGRISIESGQFVVNKRKCWEALNLAWWYNDHSDWSYLHGYGDKHTFEVAWAKCGLDYTRFCEDAVWSVHSFLHVGPDGQLLFVHRCRDKFRIDDAHYLSPQNFIGNRFHFGLQLETECFAWLHELRSKLQATAAPGETSQVPTIRAFIRTSANRGRQLQEAMARWRATDWGVEPNVFVADQADFTAADPIDADRAFLGNVLKHPAHFYLLIADDLMLNLHLRHNLENWAPVRDHWLALGSLFNPGLPSTEPIDIAKGRALCGFPVAAHDFCGAQAIVISHALLEFAMREWNLQPGAWEQRLAMIAARHSCGPVVHSPSLVQGIPDANARRAVDFDPFYRAKPADL
jgi:hypothetical protein